MRLYCRFKGNQIQYCSFIFINIYLFLCYYNTEEHVHLSLEPQMNLITYEINILITLITNEQSRPYCVTLAH